MMPKQQLKGRPSKCHPEKSVFAKEMCRSCYEKQLRENNPEYAERQRENTRKWIEKHAEQHRATAKAWVAKQDPEYMRAYKRKKKLESYGLTPEDYDQMLRDQGGGCAICMRPPGDKQLAVDHCHDSGVVRGLLCFRCNFGLSWFAEDDKRLAKAAQYVSKAV